MPQAQENFQKAVTEILNVIIFENWLRFYFIAQQDDPDGELRIEIPEKAIQKIGQLYPLFSPLAEKMNNRPVDFETSRNAVITFVHEHLAGERIPADMAQTVFASSTFQQRLSLFNAWVSLHEAQLDQGFLPFGEWLKLFETWETGPGAEKLLEGMAEQTEEKPEA